MNLVIKFLEDAIAELDGMDSIIASYKIHLNVSPPKLVSIFRTD